MIRPVVVITVLVLAVSMLFVSTASAQTAAANVTAGSFGANHGGGNYTFPSGLTIGPAAGTSGLLTVNGKIYIGLTTPLLTGDLLSVLDSAGVQRFDDSPSNAPNITFTRARGSATVRTATSLGDETGRFLFRGYDGSNAISSARLGAVIDGAVSPGVIPQAIIFKTGTTATPSERVRIDSAGRVGIGAPSPGEALYVAGNAHFTGTVTGGNIKAKYQDVAEWVPSTTDLAAGTVVILNPTKSNEVMASQVPYDTTVAGVVSAQPGLILGEEGEGKEQIATTGRVKVRVDARSGAIRVGDLLVTSEMAGTAMRSEAMEINGRKFHQPGTIIGKALEPLADGLGEILVLLSMQ